MIINGEIPGRIRKLGLIDESCETDEWQFVAKDGSKVVLDYDEISHNEWVLMFNNGNGKCWNEFIRGDLSEVIDTVANSTDGYRLECICMLFR